MRLCEAACAPVCVSLNGGKHHHTQMPAKPNEAGSAERGGEDDLWPFWAEGRDTEPVSTTSRRKPCRSFGGRAVTSARSAGRTGIPL